eukprot:12576505-Ditylum_brightwellii.AAC.1
MSNDQQATSSDLNNIYNDKEKCKSSSNIEFDRLPPLSKAFNPHGVEREMGLDGISKLSHFPLIPLEKKE